MATMEAPPRLQVRLHQGAFKNEPFVDFTKEENVRKMRAAIDKVRGQLGPRVRSDHRRQARQDLGQDSFHQSRQAFAKWWAFTRRRARSTSSPP